MNQNKLKDDAIGRLWFNIKLISNVIYAMEPHFDTSVAANYIVFTVIWCWADWCTIWWNLISWFTVIWCWVDCCTIWWNLISRFTVIWCWAECCTIWWNFISWFTSRCKEYSKVDSVLWSVEGEERYEFTEGHFLKKLMGFKTCITITQKT